MVKSELITQLANKVPSLSLKDVELGVHHILDCMSQALSQGERIEIRGFGSFAPRFRPPRQAHNPRTGERVFTEGKHATHFKPGKDLKERVNESRKTIPIIKDNSDDVE